MRRGGATHGHVLVSFALPHLDDSFVLEVALVLCVACWHVSCCCLCVVCCVLFFGADSVGVWGWLVVSCVSCLLVGWCVVVVVPTLVLASGSLLPPWLLRLAGGECAVLPGRALVWHLAAAVRRPVPIRAGLKVFLTK
jgi:hypothetical protein